MIFVNLFTNKKFKQKYQKIFSFDANESNLTN